MEAKIILNTKIKKFISPKNSNKICANFNLQIFIFKGQIIAYK